MPLFKSELQNRNNRVSIEFLARLVVNGKTVANQFPDWYPLVQRDKYDLANNLNFHPGIGTGYQGVQDVQNDRVACANINNSHERATNVHMYSHTDYRALNKSRGRIDSNLYQPVRTYMQRWLLPGHNKIIYGQIPGYKFQPLITFQQFRRYVTTFLGVRYPNTDRNVSVNGIASREQRTYTQL